MASISYRTEIKLASITAEDAACSLGCGDASLLSEIVKQSGCKAIGCEEVVVINKKDIVDDAAQDRIDCEDSASQIKLTHGLIGQYMNTAESKKVHMHIRISR